MPENVKHNLDDHLIEITSSGAVSELEIKQSFKKIRDIVARYHERKILVDHTQATSLPSDVNAFNLGTTMAYSFKDLKIAIVILEHLENQLRLLERVVVARGGNIKLFNKYSFAIDWLDI